MKPFLVAAAVAFAHIAGVSAASAATAPLKSCIKVKKYEVSKSARLAERVTYKWVRVCYR